MLCRSPVTRVRGPGHLPCSHELPGAASLRENRNQMLMAGDPMVFPFSTTAQGPSPARSHTMLDGTRGFSTPPLGEMGQGPLPHTPQRGSWIPRGDVTGTQSHRRTRPPCFPPAKHRPFCLHRPSDPFLCQIKKVKAKTQQLHSCSGPLGIFS